MSQSTHATEVDSQANAWDFPDELPGNSIDSPGSGYLHPISELSDCGSTSALSSALLEGKGRIFKRLRICLRPCRWFMPVVFEFYFGKGFYPVYFLRMYSSLLICLRTSHDLLNRNVWGRWNHEPHVCEYTSWRNVTAKVHRALPGPVGRPVLPPSALVRPWSWKKTDYRRRSVRSYLQDGRTGRFGTLVLEAFTNLGIHISG